jgi:hypothetical protein
MFNRGTHDHLNRSTPKVELGELELRLGEINQDDVRIVPKAVEHNLFAVRRDVEGSHRGPNVESGREARRFRG